MVLLRQPMALVPRLPSPPTALLPSQPTAPVRARAFRKALPMMAPPLVGRVLPGVRAGSPPVVVPPVSLVDKPVSASIIAC